MDGFYVLKSCYFKLILVNCTYTWEHGRVKASMLISSFVMVLSVTRRCINVDTIRNWNRWSRRAWILVF